MATASVTISSELAASVDANMRYTNITSALFRSMLEVSCVAGKSFTHSVSGLVTSSLEADIVAGRKLSFPAKIHSELQAKIKAARRIRAAYKILGELNATISTYVMGQGLVVRDIVADALAMLGLKLCNGGCFIDGILNRINSSMQQIWAQAHELDNFNRATHQIVFEEGDNTKALDPSIQRILGDFRLDNGESLQEVTSEFEFRNFLRLYYGGVPTVMPKACYVRSHGSLQSDSISLELCITPAPSDEVSILFDVVTEAPRYTREDIQAGTPVPMPHKYAELILLPLVRYWVAGHREFRTPDLMPVLTEQYRTAMALLGLVMPDSEGKEASR